MSLKKWFFWMGLVCVLMTAAFMICNMAVDPFGVFGDRVFNWYEYNMTLNPRVAKIAYLEQHHDEYDSYIIGSSKVSSISCEELNKYMNANFYNMTWYGGKTGDEINAAQYLLSNYEVKNLLLMVEPQDILDFATRSHDLKERMHCDVDGSSTMQFYISYLLCNPQYALNKIFAWLDRGYLVKPTAVYTAETGSYNKQKRDIEPISNISSYMNRNAENFPDIDKILSAPFTNDCLMAIQNLKSQCDQMGVHLIVATAPQYKSEFFSYDQKQISDFWRGLAKITDFWDFSGRTSIGDDARYFYDYKHFRNCVGKMVLARIFDNKSVYVPKDFGVKLTVSNVEERLESMWKEPQKVYNSVRVPILMYHSFTEDPSAVSSMTMTVENFKKHMQTLNTAGYHSISYNDLIRYVYGGTSLPDKPVIITFDDGYENNLILAAPVLEKYGFCAQIALIGCSIGKTTYKDIGVPIIPHFSIEDAQAWMEKGVIYLNSHSYDMHQVPELDGPNCRKGTCPLPGENEKQFVDALKEDCRKFDSVFQQEEGDSKAKTFTYPYGIFSELTEAVLSEAGYNVTVTTQTGIAEVVCGLPQSLRSLPRLSVTDGVSPQQLFAMMEQ